jgi:hypothetical protein
MNTSGLKIFTYPFYLRIFWVTWFIDLGLDLEYSILKALAPSKQYSPHKRKKLYLGPFL